MKPAIKRRPLALIPFLLLTVMMAYLDKRGLLLLPILLLGLQWYSMGAVFLVLLGSFLFYTRLGGSYGLTVMILALLTVETAYLDRERAPLRHYVLLALAVFLALPTYYFLVFLAPLLPSMEVTAVAAVMLVALYFFIRSVGRG
jgi:hypothetical protein